MCSRLYWARLEIASWIPGGIAVLRRMRAAGVSSKPSYELRIKPTSNRESTSLGRARYLRYFSVRFRNGPRITTTTFVRRSRPIQPPLLKTRDRTYCSRSVRPPSTRRSAHTCRRNMVAPQKNCGYRLPGQQMTTKRRQSPYLKDASMSHYTPKGSAIWSNPLSSAHVASVWDQTRLVQFAPFKPVAYRCVALVETTIASFRHSESPRHLHLQKELSA